LPVPEPDETTRFYWDGAADGRLLAQRCRSCEAFQFPPDVSCVHCQSGDLDHAELSGRGTVYTYALVERPLHAGFVDAVPYVVALVELEEQPGLRLMANIIDGPQAPLSCGTPVEVTYERRGDVTLPQFRVAAGAAS